MSTRFSGRGGWPGVLGVGVGRWFICGMPRLGWACACMGNYMGCGLRDEIAGCFGRGIRGCAAKAACVLGRDILKRKCSQLFVLEGKMAGPARQLRRRALQSLDR